MSEAQERRITLPNSIEVLCFSEKDNLEEILALAESSDFIHETEIMKQRGNFPPFNLLVYDNLLALGLFGSNGEVGACIRNYSQELLIGWIDTALAEYGTPIRIVEKTSEKGKMLERIKPRTDYDWIKYNPKSEVLREIMGKPCQARLLLESMPESNELYAVSEHYGNVKVVHMRIATEEREGLVGLQCRPVGEVQCYNGKTSEGVEKMLKEQHPNALVVREPLAYCSQGSSSRPFSCLAVIFEEVYARKIGFPVEEAMKPS